jgi:hypothetical protein
MGESAPIPHSEESRWSAYAVFEATFAAGLVRPRRASLPDRHVCRVFFAHVKLHERSLNVGRDIVRIDSGRSGDVHDSDTRFGPVVEPSRRSCHGV